MRVLICSFTYPPHLNGHAIFTADLAEGLAANGDQVVALVPREANRPHREKLKGVEVLRVPTLHLRWIHPNLNVPLGIPSFVQKVFDQFQPQVVHIQDPSPLSQAVMRRARRLNIPVLATHHSGNALTAPCFRRRHPVLENLADRVAWRLLLAHLKEADLTIVPSPYSASNLKAHGFESPLQVIPCGIHLDNFYPRPSLDRPAVRRHYGLDSEKVLFLYVGRVDAEKSLEVMLQAVALAKNDNVQFAIAGEGKESASLQRLTEQMGLSQQIRFLGWVDHDALPALLNSADVFVMPGDSESFSIATLEAMACGKPILAVRAGALPHLVTHLENGYLYDAHQPASAARGIIMLASDRVLRTRMGNASMERAKSFRQENTVRMYKEAYQTAIHQKVKVASRDNAGNKKRSLAHRSFIPALRAAILLVVFLISTLLYNEAQAIPNIKVSDLETLNWTAGQRLLVIAPHPDDEVLAAGGLIQRTLESGGEVQVVIVTNGDAEPFAPLLVEHKVQAAPDDYINMGKQRQAESLKALKTLGVNENAVDFMGYPDGGLYALWMSDWRKAAPLRSSYTRTVKSPYERTFNSNSKYLGADLYNDLLKILVQFHPDVIVLPHPKDTHSDHRAVSNFTRFAIADYLSSGEFKTPLILTYLIHYEEYPLPRGENPAKALLPPAALTQHGERWLTYSLSGEERSIKRSALRAYESQRKMIGGYIRSFVRANEIFFELPVIEMPSIAFKNADMLEVDFVSEGVLPEPKRERFERFILPSADLVGWKASRIGNILCFSVETRADLSSKLDYRIMIKMPDGGMLTTSRQSGLFQFAPDQFGSCYNLGDLDYPPVIGFSAESRYGGTIDQTVWHFLRILYDE